MSSNASSSDGGRARGAKEVSAEEKAIQTMMDKGEQDLAAKREARARARKLRFEELQKQKEAEETGSTDTTGSYRSNNHTSGNRTEFDDSLPDDPAERLSAVTAQLKDTLLTNSQLHSDKMQLVYQLDLYKDRLEDFDQEVIELRHYNRTNKQDLAVAQHQLQLHEQQIARLRQEVEARDIYLKDQNITWPPPAKQKVDKSKSAGEVSSNGDDSTAVEGNGESPVGSLSMSRKGSMDDGDEKKKRLDTHAREKQYLLEQIGRLKQEVILLKNELQSQALSTQSAENGGAVGRDVMRDTARLLSEYKAKLMALDTDKARLEGQVQRAETQLKRLRTQREEAEKMEDELKSERRKLQRDVRTAESKAEELELENERLQKRIEALRKRHQKD